MTLSSVDVLRRRRPEWVPWLAVIDEALRGIGSPEWDEAVPERLSVHEPPQMAGAEITLSGRTLRSAVDRLLDVAAQCGPAMSGLRNLSRTESDLAGLFRAAIVQDQRAVSARAEADGVDGDALQAVIALSVVPLLQACRARWASRLLPGWTGGYCPVCASWPAFAEIRGIDRSRHLRCGRCGADWHGQVLLCVYCRNADHDQLTTLVPEQPGVRGVIDACRRCHGYVKAFTTLKGTPPAVSMVEDIATVDLDIAALEQGFARPAGAAYGMEVQVTVTRSSRRFFQWNA